MAFVSTNTEFALLDSRSNRGFVTLPLTTAIPGRVLTFKDAYGSFSNSTVRLSTQAGESFEDGTTIKLLDQNWDFMQLYAGSTTKWYITGGTYMNGLTARNAGFSSLATNWISTSQLQTSSFQGD